MFAGSAIEAAVNIDDLFAFVGAAKIAGAVRANRLAAFGAGIGGRGFDGKVRATAAFVGTSPMMSGKNHIRKIKI